MENFTKKFEDLITKKNRNFSIDLNHSSVSEINKLVNLSSEKKFNLKISLII